MRYRADAAAALEGFGAEVGTVGEVEDGIWVFGTAAEGLEGVIGGGSQVKRGFVEGGELALLGDRGKTSLHRARRRGFGGDVEGLYAFEGSNGMISVVGVSLW